MEKQAHKRTPPYCWLAVAVCALLALIFLPNLEREEESVSENGTLHLVYSPYCPHCHELMRYLEDMKLDLEVEKTQNGGEAFKLLAKHGIKWRGGVPLLYAKVNSTLIAIEGFPSANQLKDGYFIGKEYEEEICNKTGGKGFYINGSYAFCKLPTGLFMGNYYSVKWLIDLCHKYECE